MYIKIMRLVFYLPTFSTLCMSYLLYLIFQCDEKFKKMEELGELDTANAKATFRFVMPLGWGA